MTSNDVTVLHERRTSQHWLYRLYRVIEPPVPFVLNPREPTYPLLPGKNLYVGGAGTHVQGYVNLDVIPLPGVDVLADVEHLPFADGTFLRVECDAVLEHVRAPALAMKELQRVTAPGGLIHVVTPFCHPFHEYPRDYRRFSPDGLQSMADGLETIAQGWRTGPTATLLVFVLEYVKLLFPWRAWRAVMHVLLGWLLFPLRYLDLLLLRSPKAGRIGNHCYIWFRKPTSPGSPR